MVSRAGKMWRTTVPTRHGRVRGRIDPALAEAGYSFTSLEGEPLGALERPGDVPYQLVAEPR
jgi:hypothetical protein